MGDMENSPSSCCPAARVNSERIAHLRDLLDERQAFNAKALELEATELARRLDNLNGEAARISSAAEKSVLRVVFEGEMKELALWRRHIDEFMTKIETAVRVREQEALKAERNIRTWLAALSVVVAVAAVLVAILVA